MALIAVSGPWSGATARGHILTWYSQRGGTQKLHGFYKGGFGPECHDYSVEPGRPQGRIPANGTPIVSVEKISRTPGVAA